MNKNFLITGSAGFIGFHLASRLLREGHTVVGLDTLPENSTWSWARNAQLMMNPNYHFHKVDLFAQSELDAILQENEFSAIFHMAGASSVQFGLDHPILCVQYNQGITLALLESIRRLQVKPPVFFPSTAAVYGTDLPQNENRTTEWPASMYGITKKSCEMCLLSYGRMYGIQSIVLRLFSVYGPWINSELAPFKFLQSLFEDRPVEVVNGGKLLRDFIYIDDVIDAILRVLEVRSQEPRPALFDIFNIGTGVSHSPLDIVEILAQALGKKARINFRAYQNGREGHTLADITKIHSYCGFSPKISIDEGLNRLKSWYVSYLEQQKITHNHRGPILDQPL